MLRWLPHFYSMLVPSHICIITLARVCMQKEKKPKKWDISPTGKWTTRTKLDVQMFNLHYEDGSWDSLARVCACMCIAICISNQQRWPPHFITVCARTPANCMCLHRLFMEDTWSDMDFAQPFKEPEDREPDSSSSEEELPLEDEFMRCICIINLIYDASSQPVREREW